MKSRKPKTPKDFTNYKDYLFYKLGEQTTEATTLLNKLSSYLQPEEITLYFDQLDEIQNKARDYINDTGVWLPDRGETYDSKPYDEFMAFLNAKLKDATFDEEFIKLTQRMYEGVEHYYSEHDRVGRYKRLGELTLAAQTSRDLTELKKYQTELFGRIGMGQAISAISRGEAEDKETRELFSKIQTEFANIDRLVKKLVALEPEVSKEKEQKKYDDEIASLREKTVITVGKLEPLKDYALTLEERLVEQQTKAVEAAPARPKKTGAFGFLSGFFGGSSSKNQAEAQENKQPGQEMSKQPPVKLHVVRGRKSSE